MVRRPTDTDALQTQDLLPRRRANVRPSDATTTSSVCQSRASASLTILALKRRSFSWRKYDTVPVRSATLYAPTARQLCTVCLVCWKRGETAASQARDWTGPRNYWRSNFSCLGRAESFLVTGGGGGEPEVASICLGSMLRYAYQSTYILACTIENGRAFTHRLIFPTSQMTIRYWANKSKFAIHFPRASDKDGTSKQCTSMGVWERERKKTLHVPYRAK